MKQLKKRRNEEIYYKFTSFKFKQSYFKQYLHDNNSLQIPGHNEDEIVRFCLVQNFFYDKEKTGHYLHCIIHFEIKIKELCNFISLYLSRNQSQADYNLEINLDSITVNNPCCYW